MLDVHFKAKTILDRNFCREYLLIVIPDRLQTTIPNTMLGRMNRPVRNLILSGAMALVVMGTWIFVLVEHSIEESQPRKFPSVAYESLPEYFIIAAIFLTASFVGACSAFRVIRSGERLVGGLLLFIFSVFFLTSCLTYWSDYRKHTRTQWPNNARVRVKTILL